MNQLNAKLIKNAPLDHRFKLLAQLTIHIVRRGLLFKLHALMDFNELLAELLLYVLNALEDITVALALKLIALGDIIALLVAQYLHLAQRVNIMRIRINLNHQPALLVLPEKHA